MTSLSIEVLLRSLHTNRTKKQSLTYQMMLKENGVGLKNNTTTPHHINKRSKMSNETGNEGHSGLNEDSSFTHSAICKNDEQQTPTIETASPINNTKLVKLLSNEHDAPLGNTRKQSSESRIDELKNHVHSASYVLCKHSCDQCCVLCNRCKTITLYV